MTKIIFCCLLFFICFSTYILGKPVKPREAKNVRNGCVCENFTCGCCANLEVPQIWLNDSICLRFGYEPKTYGISLILTIDNKTLINETISATNPPPICFPIPLIRETIDGCIHFYDLAISNKKFHGCAQLELRMWWVYVVTEYNLGCFDVNDVGKHHAKIVKLFSKTKGVNITEKAYKLKSAFVQPNTIQ